MVAVFSLTVLMALLAYSTFLVFCLVSLFRSIASVTLLQASAVTLVWLATPTTAVTRELYLAMEPIAMGAWLVLLARSMGIRATRAQPKETRAILVILLTGIVLAAVGLGLAIASAYGSYPEITLLPQHLTLLVINILGLMLIEQLSRNTVVDFRWRIRYLNIGLGTMFTFGSVHHALAISLGAPLPELVALQPAIMALVVPFMIIATLRNSQNKLRFRLSHSFVFRTGVLATTGLFALLLGLFGYLAQVFAGDIGLTVAALIGIVATTFLLVVVGSTPFRSQLRVLIGKTFFEYRYDYRDEWMKVTAQLTEPDPDFNLPQQAQRAMLKVLNAKRSCLWTMNEHGSFLSVSDIEAASWRDALPGNLAKAVSEFYRHHDWVLDLTEAPDTASTITQQLSSITYSAEAHYLVPLFVDANLWGICLIGRSETPKQLVWEDFDILKLIAKQCAGFLALESANQRLMDRQKLDAVTQISAFLLHDLKTIAAQLSLMLENAPKHKDKPGFVDDMLMTTKNSASKMERIISGIRNPQTESAASQRTDLGALLRSRKANPSLKHNVAYSKLPDGDVIVNCGSDDLNTALTHLEKNALEASKNQGVVRVSTEVADEWATVFVADTGDGMTEEFIENQLFKPFYSSKGITGMGIGAYQAREKIRSCGGDLAVESTVGVGTVFSIKLPLANDSLSKKS